MIQTSDESTTSSMLQHTLPLLHSRLCEIVLFVKSQSCDGNEYVLKTMSRDVTGVLPDPDMQLVYCHLLEQVAGCGLDEHVAH